MCTYVFLQTFKKKDFREQDNLSSAEKVVEAATMTILAFFYTLHFSFNSHVEDVQLLRLATHVRVRSQTQGVKTFKMWSVYIKILIL